ncbi:MAG TPA: lipid A deacylase LpxR family protein [Reyranella sp.]|nr:lipid A deacylase LpxR family protein [Reyranella sp.]
MKSAVLVAALLAAAGPVAAQPIPIDTTPSADEERSIFTLQVENDYFNLFGRTDRDYTNGLRIAWLSPALPDLPDGVARLVTLPTVFGEDPVTSVTRRLGLSIGQNLYTPANTDTFQPVFNDRPYAAWLYASVALQSTYKRSDPKTGEDDPVRLDTLQLDLGMVGPAAGGAFVQNNFHRFINDNTANGWAFQLHNEPTVNLDFERRWRVAHGVVFDDPKLEYDFVPIFGLNAGNVLDAVSVGGIVRIGKELRADFGPPRARPALPGSEGFIGEGFGWYVFFGLTGEAVAHNMFLDGNTDGNDIVHVTHRPFVGEGTLGATILFRGVRVSFTQVFRSPEFYEQDRFDQFASINVSFRY